MQPQVQAGAVPLHPGLRPLAAGGNFLCLVLYLRPPWPTPAASEYTGTFAVRSAGGHGSLGNKPLPAPPKLARAQRCGTLQHPKALTRFWGPGYPQPGRGYRSPEGRGGTSPFPALRAHIVPVRFAHRRCLRAHIVPVRFAHRRCLLAAGGTPSCASQQSKAEGRQAGSANNKGAPFQTLLCYAAQALTVLSSFTLGSTRFSGLATWNSTPSL